MGSRQTREIQYRELIKRKRNEEVGHAKERRSDEGEKEEEEEEEKVAFLSCGTRELRLL